MKSCTTNIILAESGEMPLRKRREWLVYKFITKARRFVHHPTLALLQDTEIPDLLWYNGDIPPYINAFKSLGLAARLIWQAEYLPFFEISYKASILTIKVLISGLPKYAIMNQSDFNNILNSRFPYTHLYNDASVSKQPDSVGFGIYAVVKNLRAVEEIIERRVKLSIIITDSLSAIIKLGNDCQDGDWDIVSINVKKSLYNAWCLGYKVVCWRIPSHSYIHGNNIADILANRGRYLAETIQVKGGPQELWSSFLQNLWED
ncbi:hypothetical protein HHI36_004949 [Cryptolaemus montrouzieri]|uniref:RNase H type-1 domain-containing protein n=1 Tax=Cryptolaemus montrouzieri TaxID=559131 RepID=A0ABD2NSX1_9CUCU